MDFVKVVTRLLFQIRTELISVENSPKRKFVSAPLKSRPMEGAGQGGPPAGRGGRGAALLAALKAKQKRPGDGGGPQGEDADSGPSQEQLPPEVLASPPAAPTVPKGRAALLSGLTGRIASTGVASTVSTPSVGRAALLEKLKIKGAATMSVVGSSIAQPSAGAGRAQLLASLKGGPSVVGTVALL